MYSINNVSLSKVVEDDVGRSSPDQNDRFERRLNNYRIHQIDCQLKNDESFREMREQESVHIKRLQEQKTCDRRQKRVNKKQSKKNKNDEPISQQQQLPVDPRVHTSVVPDQQNDLADLNYREMLTLLGVPENYPSFTVNYPYDLRQTNYNNNNFF